MKAVLQAAGGNCFWDGAGVTKVVLGMKMVLQAAGGWGQDEDGVRSCRLMLPGCRWCYQVQMVVSGMKMVL